MTEIEKLKRREVMVIGNRVSKENTILLMHSKMYESEEETLIETNV